MVQYRNLFVLVANGWNIILPLAFGVVRKKNRVFTVYSKVQKGKILGITIHACHLY